MKITEMIFADNTCQREGFILKKMQIPIVNCKEVKINASCNVNFKQSQRAR